MLTNPVFWAAVLAALAVLGGIAAMLYNRLVRGRLLVREAFSGIDVQLKRRHNLVPNLVRTVEGYADFERSVLQAVTSLRAQAMRDLSLADKQRDENQLSAALRSLLAVAERYPELKASSSFLDLQQQLAGIEDDLQKARRYYNGTVRDYNTQVESFPANLVAGLFGFQLAEFFQLETTAEAQVPEVGLLPETRE